MLSPRVPVLGADDLASRFLDHGHQPVLVTRRDPCHSTYAVAVTSADGKPVRSFRGDRNAAAVDRKQVEAAVAIYAGLDIAQCLGSDPQRPCYLARTTERLAHGMEVIPDGNELYEFAPPLRFPSR